MSARSLALATVASAGVACLSLLAVPAFADTTPTPSPAPTASSAAHAPKTLAQVQAAGAKATTDRENKLSAAITKVTADKSLSSSDRSTILGTLNADLAAMKSSAARIAADTTVGQAQTDLKAVFDTYRVLAVALPQARLASDSDRITSSATTTLTKEQATLAGLLSGKDKAKSTAALQADLSDMSSQTKTAAHDADGVDSAALAVTPAAYNANHSVLASEKAAITAARTALTKAKSDAKTIRQALK